MLEREWREASDTRPALLGLGIVLAVAAVLRFWALGSGIPYAVGIDEPQIMTRVVRIMQTGDFNPHFFDYPSLYIYVQLLVACTRFVLGASAGVWSSLAHVTDADFYLWGRALTALLGTATVYLVYLIGSRWGARHALLAAALMAVLPNHVRESHFVLTDVPMTFFTTLGFLLTLRALEKQTVRAFAWAGAAAGLAAATKYYGGLILIVPLIAACFGDRTRPRLSLALVAAGAAAFCFLLAAPYTLLDLPAFLNGFAGLSGALRGRIAAAEPGWLLYLKHMTIGLAIGGGGWQRTGYCGMLLLTWGLVHAIVRGVTGPGQARFILLFSFPLIYFVVLSDRTLIYARYLMPLFPFVALLIAIAIVSGVTLLRRVNMPRPARSALIVVLTVVAMVPPSVSSIGWALAHGRPSTYSQAYGWILQNIPAGAGVVIEQSGLRLPPAYRTKTVFALTERDLPAYLAEGIEYAVLSSDVSGPVFDARPADPARYAAYRQFLDRISLVAVFRNPRGGIGPDIRIFKLLASATPRPAVTTTGRSEK